jgi:hypothetical protein
MRKGQITLANIGGMVILLFIFAVAWEPMMNGLADAFTGANPLVKIGIVSVPLGILIAFITMPFTLSAKEEERRMAQNPRIPAGRERR